MFVVLLDTLKMTEQSGMSLAVAAIFQKYRAFCGGKCGIGTSRVWLCYSRENRTFVDNLPQEGGIVSG